MAFEMAAQAASERPRPPVLYCPEFDQLLTAWVESVMRLSDATVRLYVSHHHESFERLLSHADEAKAQSNAARQAFDEHRRKHGC